MSRSNMATNFGFRKLDLANNPLAHTTDPF